MRKVKRHAFLVTLILALALLILPFGTLTVSAAEGSDRQVTATTSASVKQGNTGYCYVYIDSLEALSSLSVTAHYDPEKVRVDSSNVYNTVSCILNDKALKESSVQFSYIFDGNGEAAKTQLFYFKYTVLSDAEIGDSYFDIVVNEAYDSSLQAISVSGSRCPFSITETITSKSCSIYSTSSISTSIEQEFELSYNLSSSQIASGSFVINYDPELFAIVGVTNGSFCNGKIVDVNTEITGAAYVSFVGTSYNGNTSLLRVKFKTLQNVAQASTIKMTVTEFFDLELNPISCSGYTTTANIRIDETYTEDSPNMSLQATYDATTDKVTLTVKLDKDSMLGAGDFVLNFNQAYLTYSSAQKGFAPTFFNINDKDAANGILKFSILSLSDITDEQTVLTVVFDVKHSCMEKTIGIEISGSGLADSLTNPILLNFVDANVTVPLEHIDGNDNNHFCDKGCGTIADDGCYDDNTDHTCDECGTTLSECDEGETVDRKCDYCGNPVDHEHVDANKDHECDYDDCTATVESHTDTAPKDHKCDSYGDACIADKVAFGEHSDGDDADHFCDYGCGQVADAGCHGGTATCAAQAVCVECGNSYGALGDHVYGELIEATEAVHTQTELTGAVAAHYFCDVCDKYFTETKDETTLEALTGEAPIHTPNADDGDCTTAISCSVCGKITTPANVSTEPDVDNDGLSGGAIAGIVAGSVVVVSIGGFSLFWFAIKKKSWAELLKVFKK